MRQFIVVGILVIVVSVALYLGLDAAHLMPVEASAQAVPVDWMWNLMLIAMSFLFALIVVPMTYSLIVFRRRKGETGDGMHVEGNTRLEILWTAIPLFVVVAFSVIGGRNLADALRRDPNAEIIKVTGFQWSWKFEYPADPATGLVITSDELHLPVDKQVLLRMTSSDVIHSFWVPEFRLKQDLVPGRFTELAITPTLIGEYKVRCAELCGTSHAYMLKPVIVTTQEEYDAWFAGEIEKAKLASESPEGFGELLVKQNGCAACHSLTGAAGIGPTWLNLSGADVPLSGGTTVVADDAYLAESIKSPQAQIVAGFETQQMPTYGFTDDEIAAIVAYIKTLK
ncbi:MAG: cytochrome c oxidase subunit II [Anaerolineales bacterium]|nr:cytochrome c oxidase subunit II [Anaerolineales bacterium]